MKNPVLVAELRHQRYVINTSRAGTIWIALALVLVIPALLTTFYYIAVALLGLPVEPPPFTVDLIENWTDGLLLLGVVVLFTMNIAQFIVVTLVSFGLAANSIQREKKGGTWDVLVLTNVRARQLVTGKWLASMWALNGDHAAIALLRIGFLCFVMTALMPTLAPDFALSRWDLLALIGLITAFTALDAMMNTASGMAATLSQTPASVTVMLFGFGRLLCVAYGLWWFINTVIQLVEPDGIHYMVYGLGGLVVYSFAVFGVLWLGQWIAVRESQVSP